MKQIFTLAVVAWIAVMAGCAGNAQRREESSAETFDARKYLTAEASGATQGEAGRAAMAALAAIFHARVQAETHSRANSYTTTGEGEQFEKLVDQMVRIETDVQLEGARIGWVRPGSGGGYSALAVLDRDQAAGRWHRELERIQGDLDAGLAALNSLTGRLPRLVALNRLSGRMAEMAMTESRLSVLGRPAMPYDKDLTAVLAERQKLRQEAAFVIKIDGEAAELFSHRLGSLLTSQGYPLVNTQQQAAGMIRGKVWFQPLALNNPDARFIRALADLTVVDLDSGEEIVAFSENIRKGHMDENEARRRALDELARQTAAKIARTLGSMGVMPADQGEE